LSYGFLIVSETLSCRFLNKNDTECKLNVTNLQKKINLGEIYTMNGLNYLTIIGNVVRDAELKTVDVNGVPTPRCTFTVAVNETRGNGEEIVTYFGVTAWREYATKIAPLVLSGRKVHVSGAVRLNQYVSNGAFRSNMQIHNATVILLDKKPKTGTENTAEIDDDELPFG
jgi:single-stranded DNA-binding protein